MSNTITLPGGVTLTLPATGQLQGLPALPTIPGLDPSSLLTTLAPAITAANPQLGAILAAVGALFQIGQAIHTQLASQPAGSNPSMQTAAQDFWSIVTKAFPLPGLTPPPPAAG